MQIVVAETPEHIARTRELFQEYWESFGFTPCFQNFDRELAELPGKYASPRGRLGLAVVADGEAGCVAIRPIDEERCELKRLYVRPGHRGKGVGLKLLMWAIAAALSCGYKEMFADTMPVMERALDMYDRIGFERIDPYGDEPTEGAIYLRLRL
ncbi:MAG: GNAT family N-acetyltransferase [Vulcanimicrobiaceae bacterium]